MKAIFLTITLFFSFTGVFCQSSVTYTYDKQGRLKSEHCESVYQIRYTYDQEGNFIDKLVTNYTGISNIKQTISYESPVLYPNPADDKITIEIPEKYVLKNISLFDVTGRKLGQIKEPDSHIEIQLTNFKSGLYFIKIESEEKTETFKLIRK